MVAADHRLASQAGIEMLQRGGNAVDAAVATAFALGVVNPASSGIGGGGFMLIYLAHSKRALALDYRETAPAAASRDMFIRNGQVAPDLSRSGGLAVAVPGEVAGLTVALHRYGRLPLAAVLEPAIRYARDGFAVETHLADEIAETSAALRRDPALARIFLHTYGSPVRLGETLRQPELTATLQRISSEGPEAFYAGAIADQVARSVQAAGGVLSESDLSGYRPQWRQPLRGRHHEKAVITMPPPASGGMLLEILGILRRDDLAALGQNSPTFLHLLTEAMQHAFADRDRLFGDQDFTRIPLDLLLAPANTALLRHRIRAAGVLDHSAYGSTTIESGTAAADGGTSHLSVMDAEGNAVACTSTINTAFGAGLVAGDTGIILNNEMDDFSAQPGIPNVYGLIGAEANAIAPHKRPLSSMAPTIVISDGEAVLALGGSGGPLIISATAEVLLNILDFDMDVAAAVAAPRVHHQWTPDILSVEPGISPLTRTALARRGYLVKEMKQMGIVQVVRRSAGMFEGASDPRKGGEALGW
jgi:gamma-glutamyltranspeptidase/glutathione hydrolase